MNTNNPNTPRQTKPLSIALIVADPGDQLRVSQNEEAQNEYAAAMARNEQFPPIDVVQIGNNYRLADGFHRLAAAKLAGKKEILARITLGNEETVLSLAMSGNSRNGMRLTTADKQGAIRKAIQRWPDKSDRAIAKIIGCVGQTVAAERRRVHTTVDMTGFGIPPEIRSLWDQCTDEGNELHARVRQARLTMEHIREANDTKYHEVDLPQVINHLKQVEVDVERAIPYAVCHTCEGKHTDGCSTCKGRGFVSEFFWKHCVPSEYHERRESRDAA